MNLVSSPITAELLDRALTYIEYRDLIDELLLQGQTTGDNHSPAMLHYTTLNAQRMARLDKRTPISEASRTLLARITRRQVWLTLTEAWCGDAAQIVPVVEHLAALQPLVTHRLILRDAHPEVMDAFLTGGSRAIPKTVFLDAESLEVLGSWGPRPAVMQERLMAAKSRPDFDYGAFAQELHRWYALNKTADIQRELGAALAAAIAAQV